MSEAFGMQGKSVNHGILLIVLGMENIIAEDYI